VKKLPRVYREVKAPRQARGLFSLRSNKPGRENYCSCPGLNPGSNSLNSSRLRVVNIRFKRNIYFSSKQEIFCFMIKVIRIYECHPNLRMKVKNFVVGLLMLTMLVQPAFVTAGVSEAVTYLQSQVDDPWITMALVAAGQTNIPSGHLRGVSGSLATDYSKTILAITALGQNPKTFGNIDYVAKLKTYYSNNQIGDVNLLNDDMWAILALASAGETNSTEVTAAKNVLLANQNTDGGWSYSVGAGSDTNDTAAAVMALVEAGLSPSSLVITNALNYLQSAQNSDGGIGYQIGSDSDSGSDSWIISALNKVGINPSSWSKNNNNPITHLNSLQDTDGGFWWVEEGTSEWNNKAMTAFAVIALSNKTYPLGYYQPNQDSESGAYHLRIQGSAGNICDTDVAASNALEMVENGAAQCSYTYTIENTSFGPYLSAINSEVAQGMSGWMYFVNYVSPPIGAVDYILEEGDEVLWYYGNWGWQPTRLSASSSELNSGQSLTVTVEYFDGQSWLDLQGATIEGGDQEYTTNTDGQAGMDLSDGYYTLYAEKENFVRSNQEVVLVGDGVSQNVNLVVEIDQGGHGRIAGESIIFDVSPSQLDFGKIEPGHNTSQSVTLVNSGSVNLNVTSVVSGDPIFTGNIKINQENWSDYTTGLTINQNKPAEVSLEVPSDYIGSGVKSGELIFWAQAQ